MAHPGGAPMRVSSCVRQFRLAFPPTLILLAITSPGSQLPQSSPLISPDSLNFGSQAVDVSSPAKSITITNRGSSPLFIFKVSASSDFAVTDDCRHPLRHNESCHIQVTFSPTFPGDTKGEITILDNTEGSPHRLIVLGTGVAPPGISSR